MEILFIGKKHDKNAEQAAEYLMQLYPNSQIVFGTRENLFPADLLSWKGDYIFSYLSPWIIPSSLLEKAKYGAINWHPGPPEYPGIGCTNFAIYNDEKIFGITCHYMLSKVDTGKIIETQRFAVIENDTVLSITQKCYSLILDSFNRILEMISHGEKLPVSQETWTRKPYTRKELNDLSEVKYEMTTEEIERRIKATTYDKPWAFINLKGRKYYLKEI